MGISKRKYPGGPRTRAAYVAASPTASGDAEKAKKKAAKSEAMKTLEASAPPAARKVAARVSKVLSARPGSVVAKDRALRRRMLAADVIVRRAFSPSGIWEVIKRPYLSGGAIDRIGAGASLERVDSGQFEHLLEEARIAKTRSGRRRTRLAVVYLDEDDGELSPADVVCMRGDVHAGAVRTASVRERSDLLAAHVLAGRPRSVIERDLLDIFAVATEAVQHYGGLDDEAKRRLSEAVLFTSAATARALVRVRASLAEKERAVDSASRAVLMSPHATLNTLREGMSCVFCGEEVSGEVNSDRLIGVEFAGYKHDGNSQLVVRTRAGATAVAHRVCGLAPERDVGATAALKDQG